jgi:hypothetical protein
MYAEARLEFDPFGPAGFDYLRDIRHVSLQRKGPEVLPTAALRARQTRLGYRLIS